MKVKKSLTHEELLSWVRLIRTPNLGPVTFATFMKVYKTPKIALEVLPDLIARCGTNSKIKSICSVSEAEKEIEKVSKFGARIIAACEEDYPDILRHISDFPPIITVLGDCSLLKKEMIAIVGGRNTSINGRNFTAKLSRDLSNLGFVTVSGLARGIDYSVHTVILKNFPTIAVMGSGIDVVYPKEHTEIYKKIAYEGGLIVTELPFGTLPKPQFFPQRNRLISGLSLGVVVVEASQKSGSLITANYALSQNREVFAVPGSPLDNNCSGNNSLIKNGAQLVESADDIVDIIRFNSGKLTKKNTLFEDENQDYLSSQNNISIKEINNVKSEIMQHLDSAPIDINEIVACTGLATNIVLAALLELELSQKIVWHDNNKVSLLYLVN